MALPKLTSTKFNVDLPYTKTNIEFRPFLVKEEKALLVAMESEEQSQMISVMRDIVNNCVETPGFDVANIPFFESEFLFLQLRAKSVGEISKLEYRHTDGLNYKGEQCDAVTEVDVNLEEVEVAGLDNIQTEYPLTDKLNLKLKFPSIMEITDLEDGTSGEIQLLSKTIEYAFDDNEIYEAETEEEKIQFIESMNAKQLQNVSNFFTSMPRVKKEIKYKCQGCGQEDTVTLEGLADFF